MKKKNRNRRIISAEFRDVTEQSPENSHDAMEQNEFAGINPESDVDENAQNGK